MVTDRTLRGQVLTSAILGYNKGARDTAVETKKIAMMMIESFKWFCTKHTECPDSRHLCSRETNEPCKYRVLNPKFEEAERDIRKA